MRLAICKERKRAILTREALNKDVLKDAPRGSFVPIFEEAQEKLREVFGMEMVELPSKDKGTGAAKKAAAKSTKQYVLRSTLDPKKMSKVLAWKKELPSMSVLYVILALIMMSNDVLTEGWRHHRFYFMVWTLAHLCNSPSPPSRCHLQLSLQVEIGKKGDPRPV